MNHSYLKVSNNFDSNYSDRVPTFHRIMEFVYFYVKSFRGG